MIRSQITWSDNPLVEFQDKIKTLWTCYWVKKYFCHVFVVTGKLDFIFYFFQFSYWKPEGGHRNHHHFQQSPVPPVSAEKLIWPSFKKEKGVGKGNNNCYSYQCLCHLHAGTTPNNFASFGSRCLLQLLCTVLMAPINSMLFLQLRVAVIWVYECEICLALPPMSDWG